MVKVSLGSVPEAQPASNTGRGPGGTWGSSCKTDCKLASSGGRFPGSQACSGMEASFPLHRSLSPWSAMSRPGSISGHWASRAATAGRGAKRCPRKVWGARRWPHSPWTWPGDPGATGCGRQLLLSSQLTIAVVSNATLRSA